MYNDAKFERKQHGSLLIDGIEVASTLQCPHCGCHFVSRKGSGHLRAFCFACKAVTCGQEKCDICVPLEKQLELMEKVA